MTALFVVWVSAAQRRTAEYLQRARDDLRATVQELENLNKSLQTENAERTQAEQMLARASRREKETTHPLGNGRRTQSARTLSGALWERLTRPPGYTRPIEHIGDVVLGGLQHRYALI